MFHSILCYFISLYKIYIIFNHINDATDKVFYFASINILVNTREMTRYLIKVIHFFHPYILVIKMYISANNTNGINPFCDKRKCRYAPNWITLWLTRSTFFCTPHFTQVQTQLSDFRQETHRLCAKNNKLLSYDKCKSIKVDFNATRLFGFRQSKLWHCYS